MNALNTCITDRNFADSVQYNSAYANHHFLLIFNHKNHSCELPDCVHVISALTSIYPLLSYLYIIYKFRTIADNEQSHESSEVFIHKVLVTNIAEV